MAQHGSSQSLSSGPLSFDECCDLLDDLSPKQPTKTEEQLCFGFTSLLTDEEDSRGLSESKDSLSLDKDGSPTIDVASALGSVGLMSILDLGKIFSVFSLEEDDQAFTPSDDQDGNPDDSEDPTEDEEQSVTFQSKFIDFFPLYQDYCLEDVKEDLFRLVESFVPELITPQYQQGLQSQVSLFCKSVALSPHSQPTGGTPSPPLTQPVRVTPSTLWQDLEEVKASGYLSWLTTREIRLQETMFELIGSEASYLRSLRVAVNHFYMSKELKKSLSKREHHVLFSNICQVMAASEKFLKDLEIRLGESLLMSEVGDIVLEHCPEFQRLYVPYVTNMMYQEALTQQLLQQNRDFFSSVKKLESDPMCQRRSLKSFLVLPFQRITRIKLILESILKLTVPGSDSVLNLERAIGAIHEIVTECNKGVQKMKQIEELVTLEMQMDFGKVKWVPLVVSGRFLLHQGPMRQLTLEAAYSSRISFINIHLHLFNDLLIISSKKDQRFTVLDHIDFPKHVHVEPLKTEVLGLPAECFLLHLSKTRTRQPTAIILATHTRSEKETWIRLLSKK